METVKSKDGTPIAFEQTGSGPAVILVSPALGDRQGGNQLAALLAEHFTVLNYDRRGRGDSGDTKPYAVEREIEDIEALIKRAGGTASLFGQSSGAALALEAARRLPDKVAGVAMFEPPYIVDNTHPPLPSDYVEHMTALIAEDRRTDAVKYFMTAAMSLPEEYLAPMQASPMWAGMEALAHTLPYDGTVMGNHMQGKPFPPGQWASATSPVLVMVGAMSPPFFHNTAQALVEALPNARRLTLEGHDHSAVFSAPQVVAQQIVKFFNG